MKRNYVIKQIDAEDEPVIARGVCHFYANDEELVPGGFVLDYVQNSPTLKTIYVHVDAAVYCTQNEQDCATCSLVNYGRDCHNNPL